MIKGLKTCAKAIFGSIGFTIVSCFCVAMVLMILIIIGFAIYDGICVLDCKKDGETTSHCMKICD